MAADAVIGVGEGKSLDAAKRASEICNVLVICIPTITSTCAAASGMSVIYTEEGVHKKDHYFEKNRTWSWLIWKLLLMPRLNILSPGFWIPCPNGMKGRPPLKGSQSGYLCSVRVETG
jgi:hypothetical protein